MPRKQYPFDLYMSPWTRYDSEDDCAITYCRYILGEGNAHYPISQTKNKKWSNVGLSPSRSEYDTKEEAMQALDKELENHCVFLTQEQWDKLSVLL